MFKKNYPKLAEFIGILLGDGYIHVGNGNLTSRLKITCNSQEEDYINYIKKLIIDLFNINPQIKNRKNENATDVFVFRKRVIDYLVNEVGLKASPKWNRAIIPKKFISENLNKNVIKGYFDTDGSLVRTNNNGIIYPRLEMKICPSPMQDQIIKILNSYGFRFGVYNIGKGKVRIQLNGKSQLAKWIRIIGFNNSRHVNKLKQFNIS